MLLLLLFVFNLKRNCFPFICTSKCVCCRYLSIFFPLHQIHSEMRFLIEIKIDNGWDIIIKVFWWIFYSPIVVALKIENCTIGNDLEWLKFFSLIFLWYYCWSDNNIKIHRFNKSWDIAFFIIVVCVLFKCKLWVWIIYR